MALSRRRQQKQQQQQQLKQKPLPYRRTSGCCNNNKRSGNVNCDVTNLFLFVCSIIVVVVSSSSMLSATMAATTTTTTATTTPTIRKTMKTPALSITIPTMTATPTTAAAAAAAATTTETTSTDRAIGATTRTWPKHMQNAKMQNSNQNENSNFETQFVNWQTYANHTLFNFTFINDDDNDNDNDGNNVSDDEGRNANMDMLSFHQYCIAHRNSFADIFTLVLYTVVCIVGLFGNTLVIYVVLRFSKMQTVTNIYILNLAIADECFLIGIPFLLYTMRICSWRFGEFMCKAYMVSTSITQFTSSIFLLIMSADRYIAVCHPIASPRYRTLHIAKRVSALAWTTSAVLMLPVILYASTVSQEDGINLSCNIEWPESYKKHSGTTFILYTFFLGFAAPLCFILCFYYLVIRKLHTVGPKTTQKSKEKRRAHRKVTRLVLTVITVYICCWLPHWISQVALINSNPAQRDLSRLEILIFLLLGCLVYSNSAMNPILYAFLSDNFRKSFFKAFTCMAQQDINAQLNVEPSIFTKQGSRRRAGSRRLLNAPQPPMLLSGLTLNAGNNNSSTTTSSTTTAEKTASTGAHKSSSSTNGRLTVPGCAESENLIVRLDQQQESTVCALIGAGRRWSADVQQTDL